MPKYVVEVFMNTCVAIEVEAHDEAEAQALALEEADPHMADEWDYEIDCVYRDGDDDDDDEELPGDYEFADGYFDDSDEEEW